MLRLAGFHAGVKYCGDLCRHDRSTLRDPDTMPDSD
jgi:hypothetical protein